MNSRIPGILKVSYAGFSIFLFLSYWCNASSTPCDKQLAPSYGLSQRSWKQIFYPRSLCATSPASFSSPVPCRSSYELNMKKKKSQFSKTETKHTFLLHTNWHLLSPPEWLEFLKSDFIELGLMCPHSQHPAEMHQFVLWKARVLVFFLTRTKLSVPKPLTFSIMHDRQMCLFQNKLWNKGRGLVAALTSQQSKCIIQKPIFHMTQAFWWN